jgi:hypothetical protein
MSQKERNTIRRKFVPKLAIIEQLPGSSVRGFVLVMGSHIALSNEFLCVIKAISK